MTRMETTSEDAREYIEDALSRLGVARLLIDTQVNLRIQQAIRRDRFLKDLLEPALEDVSQVDAAVQSALEVIGQVWRERTESGW